MDSIKSDCETEAILNFKRWETDSTGKKKRPPKYIMDVICPGDCSNHGDCKQGTSIYINRGGACSAF